MYYFRLMTDFVVGFTFCQSIQEACNYDDEAMDDSEGNDESCIYA